MIGFLCWSKEAVTELLAPEGAAIRMRLLAWYLKRLHRAKSV